MDEPNKKKRIRNAEKNRKFSTCKFADRIFFCVTNKLDDIIKRGHWPEKAIPMNQSSKKSANPNEGNQTVIAAFLIHDSKYDVLECVSLGIGTNFVDKKRIASHGGNFDCKFSFDTII